MLKLVHKPEPVLTQTAIQIIEMVARGDGNADIAREFGIQLQDAKNALRRLMVRMGADNRAQLVSLAYERGILKPARNRLDIG